MKPSVRMGLFVREKRRELKLDQQQLADKFKTVKGTIGNLELGNHCPSFNRLSELMGILGTSFAEYEKFWNLNGGGEGQGEP